MEEGDVVQLKTSEQLMTVLKVWEQVIECIWFNDNGQYRRKTIPKECLKVLFQREALIREVELKPGDEVVLVSGGPRMLVEHAMEDPAGQIYLDIIWESDGNILDGRASYATVNLIKE